MSSRIGPRSIRRQLRTVGRTGFQAVPPGPAGIQPGRDYTFAELQERLGIVRPIVELRHCHCCGELVVIERGPFGGLVVTGAWDKQGARTFEARSLAAGILVSNWKHAADARK